MFFDRGIRHISLPLFWLGFASLFHIAYRALAYGILKIFSRLASLGFGLIFCVELIISGILVAESRNDLSGLYFFHEKQDWKYYVVSTRRRALNRLPLVIYRESTLIGFIKRRQYIGSAELVAEDIDPLDLQHKYNSFYFGRAKTNTNNDRDSKE